MTKQQDIMQSFQDHIRNQDINWSGLFHDIPQNSLKYLQRHRTLIEESGGTVEDHFFVTNPGCKIILQSQVPSEALNLFEKLYLDPKANPVDQCAELNSRLTYLSFKDEKDQFKSSKDYHKLISQKLSHLSVWGSMSVTFMITGISIETSMELIAHSECRVARLTSSKTKAMDFPLFSLQGSFEQKEYQKYYLGKRMMERFSFERDHTHDPVQKNSREWFNILAPGAKATSLTYTMNLKDFHKLFIGRLSSSGNETQVQEICRIMAMMLHEQYPIPIRHPDEYYAMGNNQKYLH